MGESAMKGYVFKCRFCDSGLVVKAEDYWTCFKCRKFMGKPVVAKKEFKTLELL